MLRQHRAHFAVWNVELTSIAKSFNISSLFYSWSNQGFNILNQVQTNNKSICMEVEFKMLYSFGSLAWFSFCWILVSCGVRL
jgi:hypothetical protein